MPPLPVSAPPESCPVSGIDDNGVNQPHPPVTQGQPLDGVILADLGANEFGIRAWQRIRPPWQSKRGASTASLALIPKSRMLTRTWRTEVDDSSRPGRADHHHRAISLVDQGRSHSRGSPLAGAMELGCPARGES